MNTQQKNSHVIFIAADQLRYDVLGKGFTPHIDALAKESICFSNAYCACPLCVPARGSLFTGMYPNSTGCLINPWEKEDAHAGYVREGIPNLYELLEENGWDCIHSGKQHFFTAGHLLEERKNSKTRWLTTEKTYREFLKQHQKPMPGGSEFRSPVPEILRRTETIFTTCSNANTGRYAPGKDFYFDCYFTKHLLEGIKERDQSKPLFLSAMFLAPHPPLEIPDPWYLRYRLEDVCLPENVGTWYPHQSPLQLYNVTGALGSHYQKDAWRESWRAYLGLVSLLDDCVGKLLSELKRQNIYDDCLILFTSDHGEMLGSHRLFQKMCMYQESVKVPLYLRLPGGCRKQQISQNISHIDVFPTLCHYLGLSPGTAVQGRSLHPLIEENNPNAQTPPVFIQYDGNSCLSGFQRCVIDGKLKLIMDVFQKETFFELYPIENVPQETKNLLFEPGFAREGARLFSLLLEHMENTGDALEKEGKIEERYKEFIRRISQRAQ